MVARLDVDDHPVIEGITDPAVRSLDKPKAQKFRKMFLGSVAERDLFSRSGIYLGSAPTFTANVSRQNKVMKRVVRGLFYHEFNELLAPTHDSVAWIESSFDRKRTDPKIVRALQEQFEKTLAIPAKSIGHDAFIYWALRDQNDRFCSSWVMAF